MTDARMPDRWLGDPTYELLSDAARVVLTSALMWSCRYGTDGAMPSQFLHALYRGEQVPRVYDELERLGWWERTENGYQLVGWEDKLGQSTAATVEHQKRMNRERARRHRANQAAELLQKGETAIVPRHVTRYVTPEVGQERTETETGGEVPDEPLESIPSTPEALAECSGCGVRQDRCLHLQKCPQLPPLAASALADWGFGTNPAASTARN